MFMAGLLLLTKIKQTITNIFVKLNKNELK